MSKHFNKAKLMVLSYFLIFSHTSYAELNTLNQFNNNPAKGWYFNEKEPKINQQIIVSSRHIPTETNNKEKKEELCKDPEKWTVDCSFVDPTKLGLTWDKAFDFEQKQYKALVRNFTLYPNDTEAVYSFQKFNMWVLNQAMTSSYTAQFNLAQHPEIDANIQVPVSQFGLQLIKNIEQNSEIEFWKTLSKTSFYVLITRSDNEYCHAQGTIMHMLEQETAMTVWNFSIDNNHLPGFDHYLNYPSLKNEVKEGILDHIQMNWLPAVYLYLKPVQKNELGRWIRVSSGITPLDEIKERTINFVESYRHAIVSGVGENKKIQPDFSVNNLYQLANEKLGLTQKANGGV